MRSAPITPANNFFKSSYLDASTLHFEKNAGYNTGAGTRITGKQAKQNALKLHN
jgi:hypothetical protein